MIAATAAHHAAHHLTWAESWGVVALGFTVAVLAIGWAVRKVFGTRPGANAQRRYRTF